jgi:hypothetical protein
MKSLGVTILLVFAFVFFAIGAGFPFAPPSEPWRLRIVSTGLAFLTLAELVAKSLP